jgi:hypothetical protein
VGADAEANQREDGMRRTCEKVRDVGDLEA